MLLNTEHKMNLRISRLARIRQGFTLVELLIVVAILLILTTLTVVLYNSAGDSDKIRSSARQLQSALLGARDRAIRAKAPRGLRLIVDTIPANNSRVISSMIYIGAPEVWTQGYIQIARADFSPADQSADSTTVNIVRGWGTDWQLLFAQGLLTNGSRIEIPANSGSWYTVDTSLLQTPPTIPGTYPNPPDDYLILTGTGYRQNAVYVSPAVGAFPVLPPDEFGVGQYKLELQPAILPGQEPLKLSPNIVVDVDRSQLPTLGAMASSLDIMFTPRGLVGSGNVVASGLLNFYLCTQEDAELNTAVIGTASYTDPMVNNVRNPADPQSGEKLILTLFPQTGNIATAPVDPTDIIVNATGVSGVDGLADDPFKFAKIGATASR